MSISKWKEAPVWVNSIIKTDEFGEIFAEISQSGLAFICTDGDAPAQLRGPYSVLHTRVSMASQVTSDGSTASYYELPANATELQHLVSAKDMNAQIGEIFRATYRYGQCSHSDKLRDAKKIKFYIVAEIDRLEALQNEQ